MSLLNENKLRFLIEQANRSPFEFGSMVEVGVYKGGSLLELALNFPDRKIFGFDTFEGMPTKYFGDDEPHGPGDFNDLNFKEISQKFKDITNVTLVQGIFPQSYCYQMPISFVHLDMDHWRGTLAALTHLWPSILRSGVIVFDDYEWKNCPGIAPVVQTWAAAKDIKFEYHGNQAVIVKPY